MKNLILTFLTTAVVAASGTSMATAAERHQPRKIERVVSEPVRNANASLAAPVAASPSQYSGGWSAPAGH